MAWQTILPGHEIPDAKQDAKSAVSFGAFRVSENAVYLNGREYLPLEAVQKARLYSTQMSTHGCCGLGLPVWNVLLYYGAQAPLRLMHEKQEKARRALALVASYNPSIELME